MPISLEEANRVADRRIAKEVSILVNRIDTEIKRRFVYSRLVINEPSLDIKFVVTGMHEGALNSIYTPLGWTVEWNYLMRQLVIRPHQEVKVGT